MPFDAGFQSESVADLIDRARAMIASRESWCQQRLADDLGRHCAIGALTAVVFGDGEYAQLAVNAAIAGNHDVSERLLPHSRQQIKTFLRASCYLDSVAARHGYRNIMTLNDYQRTFLPKWQHKRVLQAMREAADWARREEAMV